MNDTSLLFQTRQPSNAMLNNPNYFVESIRKSIQYGRLNRLHSLVKDLSQNPSLVSVVVPTLNRLFNRVSLSFVWYPSSENEPCFMLIKNGELGLILSSAPDVVPRALAMFSNLSDDEDDSYETGFCEALAENVMTRLAKQARSIRRCINWQV